MQMLYTGFEGKGATIVVTLLAAQQSAVVRS